MSLTTTQTLTLDVSRTSYTIIPVKEFDNKSRILDMYLKNRGEDIKIPTDNVFIRLKFKTSDKKYYVMDSSNADYEIRTKTIIDEKTGKEITVVNTVAYGGIVYDETHIQATLPKEVLSSDGKMSAELSIYTDVETVSEKDLASATLLTTFTFYLNVEKAVWDNTTTASDPNYSLIDALLINVEQADEKTSESTKKAEDAAEAAKTSAGEAKTSANEASTSANEAKGYLSTVQADADAASESATNAKEYADQSSTSATTSQSWAVGGTGTREGEDTDNSKNYFELTKQEFNSKAEKSQLESLITDVSFNEADGKFTFTYYVNGTGTAKTLVIDTAIEKIATNFTYDQTTEELVLTLEDGSTQRISLKTFISPQDFIDNDRISVTVTESSGNKLVEFDIKKNSITEDYIDPQYMTDIKAYSKTASDKATEASTSADSAASSVEQAKLWAEYTDDDTSKEQYHNSSKYYAEQASSSAITASTKASEASTSADNAKASETASATSESNAKASEDNAKASEDNAKTSETNAKTSETNASDSAANAKTSETNAAASESNAKTSETNAKTSETNAKTSEDKCQDILDTTVAEAEAELEKKLSKTVVVATDTVSESTIDSWFED